MEEQWEMLKQYLQEEIEKCNNYNLNDISDALDEVLTHMYELET